MDSRIACRSARCVFPRGARTIRVPWAPYERRQFNLTYCSSSIVQIHWIRASVSENVFMYLIDRAGTCVIFYPTCL